MNKFKAGFISVLFFFCGLISASENSSPDVLRNFFNKYFEKYTFKVIKKEMDVGGAKIYLAVRYVDQKDSRAPVFRKGVAVAIEGDKVVPLLYFENNLILGKDRKILVDLRPHRHKCYGWLFNTPRKKPDEIYHNGFSINVAWVMDESHLNTAQDPPISIKWDKKKKVFIEWVYDNEK